MWEEGRGRDQTEETSLFFLCSPLFLMGSVPPPLLFFGLFGGWVSEFVCLELGNSHVNSAVSWDCLMV
jgi:hypothetical protein